jgi:hypothetical protein
VAGFAPDAPWQQALLDLAFRRFDVDYVGDWHRHVGSNDHPSATDYRTAARIVTSKAWNKSEAVFPIVVVRDGRVAMRAYRITRAQREFVEIPIEVVPDTDPRIRSVMLESGRS